MVGYVYNNGIIIFGYLFILSNIKIFRLLWEGLYLFDYKNIRFKLRPIETILKID